MKKRWLLALLLGTTVTAVAAATNDGAVISNTGSTNTMGYSISLWSDGAAQVTVRGQAARTFSIDGDLAARFFTDVKAARDNPGAAGHCMKSASFGTSTSVLWHGWNSADLQCPPLNAEMSSLAQDVKLVQQAANVTTVRRIPIPHDMRMIPSATPEVTPT